MEGAQLVMFFIFDSLTDLCTLPALGEGVDSQVNDYKSTFYFYSFPIKVEYSMWEKS